MRALFILILVSFCFYTPVWASEADLLNPNRPQSTQSVYPAQPVVFIDSVTDASSSAAQRGLTDSFSDLPPVSVAAPVTLEVTPYVGPETSVSFIEHTTDWNTQIQIFPEGDILVKESFTLIQKQPDFVVTRSYTAPANAEIEILSMKRDGLPILFNQHQTPDSIIVTDQQELAPGAHRYDINYRVSNALQLAGKTAQLTVSLTDHLWPKAVERFSGIVLMPAPTKIFNVQILFGTNDIAIKEAAEIQTDENGTLFFKLRQPLPAHAKVTLSVAFDASFLTKPTWEDFLIKRPDWYFTGLWFLLITAYVIGYLIYFKYHKNDSSLKYLAQKTPFFIKTGLNKLCLRASYDGLDTLAHQLESLPASLQPRRNLKTRLMNSLYKRACFNKKSAAILFFLSSMKQYLIALLILFVLGLTLSAFLAVPLGLGQISFMIFVLIGAFLLLYQFGVKSNELKQIRASLKVVSDPKIAFGQKGSAFHKLMIRLTPYILACNVEKCWLGTLRQQAPDHALTLFLLSNKGSTQ